MKRRTLAIPRGAAIAVLFTLLIAVPVAADVGLQNFMRAEVTTSEPCFVTSAGADVSSGGLITFDSSPTVDADGVDLVQESLAVRAFAGDRLIYSEALVIENTCDIDLTVTFLNADDPSGGLALEPTTGQPWSSINMRFFLTDAAGATVPGLPDSYTTMLEVLQGVVTAPGSTIIPAGESRNLAITIDTDGAVPADSVGTIRWEAIASNS